MSLRSRTKYDGKIAIIDLKGPLIGDDETIEFRETVTDFIEQGNKCLIVNLQKATYLNSSGLGALIAAHTSYVKNGGQIRLAGIGNNIQNLLTVTRLIEVFDVFDTVEEAIESFVVNKEPSSISTNTHTQELSG